MSLIIPPWPLQCPKLNANVYLSQPHFLQATATVLDPANDVNEGTWPLCEPLLRGMSLGSGIHHIVDHET